MDEFVSTNETVNDNKYLSFQLPKSPCSSRLNPPNACPISSSNLNKLKNVHFSKTRVYHFSREQGYSSVPERGGCSLGMNYIHFDSDSFGAVQYQRIRRIEKRLQVSNGRSDNVDASSTQGSGRYRRRRFNNGCISVIKSQDCVNPGDSRRVPILYSPPNLSPQSYEHITPDFRFSMNTPPPPCLSPPKKKFSTPKNLNICIDNVDTIDTDSEASMDSSSFKSKSATPPLKLKKKLLPLHPNVRSRLLKQSGVKVIDESERWNCAKLRADRSRVGCNCLISPCNPETCSCAMEGVPCQVDRPGFPCSCCSMRCCNPNGRVEFSESRVRAHAAHVLDRLAADTENDHQPSFLPFQLIELSTNQGECTCCVKEATQLPPMLISHQYCNISPLILSSPSMAFIPSSSPSNCRFRAPISPKQGPHSQEIISPSTLPVDSESQPSEFSTPIKSVLPTDAGLPLMISVTRNADSITLVPPCTFPSDEIRLSNQPIVRSPGSILLKNRVFEIPSLTAIEGATDRSLLSRLSLRKRRIIRSHIPVPYRKRTSKKLLPKQHLDSIQETIPPSPKPILPKMNPDPLPPHFTENSTLSLINRQVIATTTNSMNSQSPSSRRRLKLDTMPHCVCAKMCETNDSLPVGSNGRVWPPADGVSAASGSDVDEIWDDSELMAHYKQVEMQVKAQVEAFRAGRAGAPNRKKRRNQAKRQKAKQTVGGCSALTFSQSDEHTPLPAPHHHIPESNQQDAQHHNCVDEDTQLSNLISSQNPAATSDVAPVYPWLLPTVEVPPDFLTANQAPPINQCCSCHAVSSAEKINYHLPPSPPLNHVQPQQQQQQQLSAEELDTAALLRAWYEAGYAMGQAHAEQVLGLRNPKASMPGSTSSSSGGGGGNDLN